MTVAALAEPIPKLMIVIPSAVALGIGLSSQQTRVPFISANMCT